MKGLQNVKFLEGEKLVTKAVILAAGFGSRFGVVTQEIPKGLILLDGKPLLEHVLEKIKGAGIEEIGIVVGHKGEMIKEHFGDGSRFNVRITYAVQEKIDGVHSALMAIEHFVDGDDFLMACCDILTVSSLRPLLIRHTDGAAGIIGVTRFDEPTNKAIVVCRNGSNVEGVYVESSEHTSHFVDAAFLTFPGRFFAHLKENNNYIDALNQFVSLGGVEAVELPGEWFNINSQEELVRAEQHLQQGKEVQVEGVISQPSVMS